MISSVGAALARRRNKASTAKRAHAGQAGNALRGSCRVFRNRLRHAIIGAGLRHLTGSGSQATNGEQGAAEQQQRNWSRDACAVHAFPLRWITGVVLNYNTDTQAVNCLSSPTDGTPSPVRRLNYRRALLMLLNRLLVIVFIGFLRNPRLPPALRCWMWTTARWPARHQST